MGQEIYWGESYTELTRREPKIFIVGKSYTRAFSITGATRLVISFNGLMTFACVLLKTLHARFLECFVKVLYKHTGVGWEKSPATPRFNRRVGAVAICYGPATGGRKGWRFPTLPELQSLV